MRWLSYSRSTMTDLLRPSLPMNNPDAALEETGRAINELGFRAIYLNSAMYSGEDVVSPISPSCVFYFTCDFKGI
jgi:hypothetical protein